MNLSPTRFHVAAGALAAALALCAPPTAQALNAPASPAPLASAAPSASVARKAAAKPSPLTPDARQLLGWVRASNDHRGQPFAVIDKRNARLMVFDGQARLRGSAPVLLGLARGDDTVPGIGERPLSQVLPHERTTPAGRFVGEHGTNARGEDVVWIDYDAAVSMHPVLTTNAKERRLQRLATPGVADNRISYGCVNVPKAFFANVVLKTLSATPNPVVYVLPETRPLATAFAGLAQGRRAGGGVQAAAAAARKQ